MINHNFDGNEARSRVDEDEIDEKFLREFAEKLLGDKNFQPENIGKLKNRNIQLILETLPKKLRDYLKELEALEKESAKERSTERSEDDDKEGDKPNSKSKNKSEKEKKRQERVKQIAREIFIISCASSLDTKQVMEFHAECKLQVEDLNKVGECGLNPLMAAVISGDKEKVQGLIDQGANNLNEENTNGMSAALLAEITEDQEMIEMLRDNAERLVGDDGEVKEEGEKGEKESEEKKEGEEKEKEKGEEKEEKDQDKKDEKEKGEEKKEEDKDKESGEKEKEEEERLRELPKQQKRQFRAEDNDGDQSQKEAELERIRSEQERIYFEMVAIYEKLLEQEREEKVRKFDAESREREISETRERNVREREIPQEGKPVEPNQSEENFEKIRQQQKMQEMALANQMLISEQLTLQEEAILQNQKILQEQQNQQVPQVQTELKVQQDLNREPENMPLDRIELKEKEERDQHKNAAELAIEKVLNIDVDEVDINKLLFDSVVNGQSMVAMLLINCGADINYREGSKSVIEVAVEKNNGSLVAMLSLFARREVLSDAIERTISSGNYITAEVRGALVGGSSGHLEIKSKVGEKEVKIEKEPRAEKEVKLVAQKVAVDEKKSTLDVVRDDVASRPSTAPAKVLEVDVKKDLEKKEPEKRESKKKELEKKILQSGDDLALRLEEERKRKESDRDKKPSTSTKYPEAKIFAGQEILKDLKLNGGEIKNPEHVSSRRKAGSEPKPMEAIRLRSTEKQIVGARQ